MAAIGLFHEHRPSQVQDVVEWSTFQRKRKSSIVFLGPEEEEGAREGLEALMLASEKLVGTAVCVNPKVVGHTFEEQDKILEAIDSPLMYNSARNTFRRSIVDCRHARDEYKPTKVNMIVSGTGSSIGETVGKPAAFHEADLEFEALVKETFNKLDGADTRRTPYPDALQAEVVRKLDKLDGKDTHVHRDVAVGGGALLFMCCVLFLTMVFWDEAMVMSAGVKMIR